MGRETMRSFGKIVLCAYGVTKYRVVVGYKFISQQENIEFWVYIQIPFEIIGLDVVGQENKKKSWQLTCSQPNESFEP